MTTTTTTFTCLQHPSCCTEYGERCYIIPSSVLVPAAVPASQAFSFSRRRRQQQQAYFLAVSSTRRIGRVRTIVWKNATWPAPIRDGSRLRRGSSEGQGESSWTRHLCVCVCARVCARAQRSATPLPLPLPSFPLNFFFVLYILMTTPREYVVKSKENDAAYATATTYDNPTTEAGSSYVY